jgi:HSP20 family protein
MEDAMADTRETRDRERTRGYAGGKPQGASYPGTRERTTSLTNRPYYGTPTFGAFNSPFSMMRRMFEDMDRMFYDWGAGTTLAGDQQSLWSPQIETFRRGNNLVVRADLPGMNKENVNVDVEDDQLIISGERQDEYNEERDDFFRSERSYGRFYRSIPLPEGVDANACKAEFKNGVLEITLPVPKETEQERRRIDIK